ncbi:MAG: UDP-N-acetylmuramate dehydrogenase [Planctomycetota bacterium]|nr:UDP-N-acetylmuramate dehydrogenase [Planctomycetota bacterium]
MNPQESISLRDLCWYRIGGKARYYAEPESLPELESLLSWVHKEGLPRFLLGHGSNVLFADDGFAGLVIQTRKLNARRDLEAGVVEVEAGFPLPSLVKIANAHGWQGLEFFAGIPGTIGGAVWGNAGACGEQVGDRVSQVLLMEPGGPGRWVEGANLPWKYRCSGIEDRVVASVRLELSPGADPQQLKKKSTALEQQKRATQPYEPRSCGCIFRNPEGTSAGELIEKCGFKGLSIGGARISPIHANFIVNEKDACSDDIERLIKQVQRKVREQFQVDLIREVIMPGQQGGRR